jgi:ribonuclease P protein component
MSSRLSKQNRLRGQKRIERLFEEGDSFTSFPFRVVWRVYAEESSESSLQWGVSVPKKKIPLAVNRNKIKRLIREAYRQEKGELCEQLQSAQKGLDCMFIYLDRKPYSAEEMKDKISVTLRRLGKEV